MSKVNATAKLVVFDMDSVLLQERFIDVCAKEFNFFQALTLLRQIDNDAISFANRTASFLTGKNIQQLYKIAAAIPVVQDLDVVTAELRSRGCVVGIISSSYQQVVDLIGTKMKADFAVGYELKLQGEYITGELHIPAIFQHSANSSCRHRVCKSNVLRNLCDVYSISFNNCIVVGYEVDDACLIKHAGMNVSLCGPEQLFTDMRKKEVGEQTLRQLLTYASHI